MEAVNCDTDLGTVVWSGNGDSSMSSSNGQPGQVECVRGIETSWPEGRPGMS